MSTSKTFKFKINNFFQKNFEAKSYRIALIQAKAWRDEKHPNKELKPA